jgi:hypothetical protein
MDRLGYPHLCLRSITLVSEDLMSSNAYSSNSQNYLAQWVWNGNRMLVLLLLITVLSASAAHELLDREFIMYGALYAECKERSASHESK